MKNNISKAASLLEQAINALPDDFALTDAKSLARAALFSLQKVEARRHSRQKLQETIERQAEDKKEQMRAMGMPMSGGYGLTTGEAKTAILSLDKMIAHEKKLIEKSHDPNNTNDHNSNDKAQILHG